jgi:hypothetical protein
MQPLSLVLFLLLLTSTTRTPASTQLSSSSSSRSPLRSPPSALHLVTRSLSTGHRATTSALRIGTFIQYTLCYCIGQCHRHPHRDFPISLRDQFVSAVHLNHRRRGQHHNFRLRDHSHHRYIHWRIR